MEPNVMRKVTVLAAAAAVGSLALAVQYAFQPTPLPASGEYFLTELARAQIGPLSVLMALATAFAFGFFVQAQPVLVGFCMLAVFPIVAMYEGTGYRGSHNLFPFEMAIVATWAIPLILAAWLGRLLARRSGRRDIWSGTGEHGITSR